MVAYDVRARTSAARMLAPIAQGGKGQVVTLTRQTAGARDTTTGIAAITTTTQYGSGVEEAYAASMIDGSLIRVGDKKLLLSALKFNSDGSQLLPATALTAPVPEETLVTFADASVWVVKRSDPLAPAGTPIMYTLHLRTGG